jgi:transposase
MRATIDPWSGPEPPAAVYFYSPDRKAERPAAHLQDFRGGLQVHDYAGFERLASKPHRLFEILWRLQHPSGQLLYDFKECY